MSMPDKAWAQWLRHEGGYVDDPEDPGGETKYGVAKTYYPDEDIPNLTKSRARGIISRDYWDALSLSDMPYELAEEVFDMAGNCGRGAATGCLQRALNDIRRGEFSALVEYCSFGPLTRAAVVRLRRYARAVLGSYRTER